MLRAPCPAPSRLAVPLRVAPLLAAPLLAGVALVALPLAAAPPAGAVPVCTFLQPIGGDGVSPIVAKQVGRGKLIGRTNWNTDFIVDRPYDSYKFFFTANSSSGSAQYPVTGFLKFSDGSNLQVFNETMAPPIGTGRRFGPFPAVPGKQTSQANFKIGASDDPGALGFSYRISVQGCTGR